MPNHVTTIISVNPQVAEALLRRDGDTARVDFAKVIPEPESIFQNGCDGRHPHPKEDGSGYYEHCWNDWNSRHWGTKWNAYDTEVTGGPGDQAVVQFDSAWSHPLPVIAALSQRFPDDVIDVRFADEDLGYNLGAYSIKGGEVLSESAPEPGSDEALEMAAQIKYGRPYADLRAEWDAEDD